MTGSLLDARLGDEVVLDVPAAEAALRLRLAEMGLRCGQCVCPLQRTPGGGRIVEVGTTRIALDRGTCRLLALLDAGTQQASTAGAGTASVTAGTGAAVERAA